MIVADTNTVSTFARIGRLDLTAAEKSLADTLPGSLNAGERECIAVCAQRPDGKLLTNDKRAHTYRLAHQIPAINLKLSCCDTV
ncbi:MAG: hypothetical protein ACREXT_14700 [Gammaproteobacteria bacterium]